MWSWLKEKHPVIYELIWCVVDGMALASIIISIICIVSKG